MKITGVYKALYDYQAQYAEELSFKEGHILYVINSEDVNWYKARLDIDGPLGLVPANYVQKVKPKESIKALYSYTRRVEEELSFAVNETMALYDSSDPDWLIAETKEGSIGLVPKNYVEIQKYERNTPPKKSPVLNKTVSKKPDNNDVKAVDIQQQNEQKWGTALYPFNAENTEETSLEANEQVLVIDCVSSPDWWTIQHKNGISGLVPATYVNLSEQNKPTLSDSDRAGKAQNIPMGLHSKKDVSYIEGNKKERRNVVSSGLPEQAKLINESSHPITHEKNEPNIPKMRVWTDRTGSFKVDAQYVCYINGKIRLHKSNGVKIDVPLEKMCKEDIDYIEKELNQKIRDDKTDNVPLAHLAGKNNRFTWMDYFKRTNIPLSACAIYAKTFESNGLQEKDIDRLTYTKMRTLGLSERHVRRIQRFIETNQSEPPSEDEGQKKKKKKVTFGGVTYINYDDTGEVMNDLQQQMQQDERLARELQETENSRQNETHTGYTNVLQRRATGRAIPTSTYSTASPVLINNMTLNAEPLKPVPVASVPTLAPPPLTQYIPNQPTNSTTDGFDDDAWRPRSSPSSTTQSVAINTPSNNVIQDIKWDSLAPSDKRPVPPIPSPVAPSINQYSAIYQQVPPIHNNVPRVYPSSLYSATSQYQPSTPVDNNTIAYQSLQDKGRNWAESTPENPFGVRLRPVTANGTSQPYMTETPTQSYSPALDPNDKYAVFKTINPNSTGTFASNQQTGNSFPNQPPLYQNTGSPSFVSRPNYNRW